jgi:hypothetical protein
VTDTPIACTLSEGDMRRQLVLTAQLRADALLDQRRIDGGVRSTFSREPDVERRVREIVELESRCCAFLDFRVTRDAGALTVDITGPADALPLIEQFFAATRR